MPAVHSCQENLREPETMREQECTWKHSPWTRSCLASLALAFLTVCDVRVKGSHVSPGYRLVSHVKIIHTLGYIFFEFVPLRVVKCQGGTESHSVPSDQKGKIRKCWLGKSIFLLNFASTVPKVSLQDFLHVLAALWPKIPIWYFWPQNG